jgi:type I restriction enzyme R subunit
MAMKKEPKGPSMTPEDKARQKIDARLMDKAKAGVIFTPDQLVWLNLNRDPIATSLSIEPDDFDCAPFSQRGGLGKRTNYLAWNCRIC